MERRAPKSAALIAVAVFASGCTPGKIGAGGSQSDKPIDRPRAATAPDHTDQKLDQDSNAADEGADDEAVHSKVGVPGLAQGADTAPPGASAEPERPSAHNTGPSDPGALTPSESLTIKTDGAVLEDLDITGMVTIDADNVTLRNFRLNATSSYGIKIQGGHSGIVIEDGEIIRATSTAILGVGYTGRRLYIHDIGGDGLKIQYRGAPTVIEYSFIERLGGNPGAHADGIQSDGPVHDVTIRYNNIWMPYPGTPPYPGSPWTSNAALITTPGVSNYVLEHNWLTGGNYTIYCEPGISVRNNRFGRYNRRWADGRPQDAIRTGTCGEWSGNRWEDTGGAI